MEVYYVRKRTDDKRCHMGNAADLASCEVLKEVSTPEK
jgi:hypothetical protein